MTGQIDLVKIEQLLSGATNPRQKAMYQTLLEKARLQKVTKPTSPANPASPATPTEATSPTSPASPIESTSPAYLDAIFQAIGMIKGEVNFSDERKATVKFSGKEYLLLWAPRRWRAYEALKKQIEATGNHLQRLVVYPKVMHFPKRDQPYAVAFQLVGRDGGTGQPGASQELDDFEFKFKGLWQFIPVCRTPCISIHRNFSPERLEFIKQADPAMKVKFMKASHLPLLWRDPPLKPFRFNPKAGKDQGHPAFVQIKVKFLPEKNVFVFDEQLDSPSEKAPRFLKSSQKDKAEAQRLAREKKRNEETKGDQE